MTADDDGLGMPRLVPIDRLGHEMRHPTLRALLLVSTSFLACGESEGTGGVPTQPVAPVTQANVVASGGVSVGLCSGPGCSYAVDYRNEGNGCGNSLHGKIRVYEDDTLLESDDWWLDSTRVIRPGETLSVEDCCLEPDTIRRGTRFTAEAFWNNVSCG